MGVVYRATDTTLDRDVAIKVLPESMASDAERIARFDREAKTLASLNHPNIAQIYGLERSDDTTALVMELVEGPTLADRIEQGAIPADEALGIAMQIAEALEAAHSQSIVHRDLKPANIKLRPDGTVKVLDFGIAKALEPENLTSGPQSPMLTTPATQVGVILGTAAYMSPEQARGKQVDQRTDIWAFGCLLYEMLTGQLAFGGEDVSVTLARIIANDTNFDSLPAAISPAARRTIELCLEKDLAKRVADIRDVKLALGGAFETLSQQAAEAGAAVQPNWRRALPVAIAVVVTGLVFGFAAWSLWPGSSLQPLNRFVYFIPEDQPFRRGGRRTIALSPDGRHFVYNTVAGLFLRRMGELEAQLIAGTEEDLSSPFFSPDGQAVAYWNVSGQLKRIAVTGGAPVVVADEVANILGGSWGADDTILYGQSEGIYRVLADGGTPDLVIPTSDGERASGPELLPDGDSVLFSLSAVTDSGSSLIDPGSSLIVVQSLSTGERTVLLEGGADARYAPTGHLVYAFDDGLFAIRFDLDTLTVSGGPVPLLQGLARAGATDLANYGIAGDGTLIYLSGAGGGLLSFAWVDRAGGEELVAASPGFYQEFSLSPDATRVAVRVAGADSGVWIYDLIRNTTMRLTFEADEVAPFFPRWTPDGTHVAFGPPLSWKRADGTGQIERLVDTEDGMPQAFSPDGTMLVFQNDGAGGAGLGVLTLDGDQTPTVLLDQQFSETSASLSTDGRWLAYVSDESGVLQVYVRPFPDVETGRWQISTDGGEWPVWSPVGDELFYRSPTGIMALAFEADPTFTPGALTQVVERPIVGARYRRLSPSPDGQRFLIYSNATISGSPDGERPQIIVVQNWFEELERLVPIE